MIVGKMTDLGIQRPVSQLGWISEVKDYRKWKLLSVATCRIFMGVNPMPCCGFPGLYLPTGSRVSPLPGYSCIRCAGDEGLWVFPVLLWYGCLFQVTNYGGLGFVVFRDMGHPTACLVLLLSGLGVVICRESPIFMNQFAVHVPSGENDLLEIAERHGYRNLGKVSGESQQTNKQKMDLKRGIY